MILDNYFTKICSTYITSLNFVTISIKNNKLKFEKIRNLNKLNYDCSFMTDLIRIKIKKQKL